MSQTHMRELLEKMHPLFKDEKEAQRIWMLWLVEQREGREWIEQMLEIEYNRIVRPYEKRVLLLTPPPRDFAQGLIQLGHVIYNNRELYPFGLPDTKSLLQHTAIFGRSGAGKTNLLFKLLTEIQKQKVPYWIFDWKRDYRPLIANQDSKHESSKHKPLVFTVGRTPSPLLFNPLLPPIGFGTDVERYVAKVIDIIGRAFYVGHGVKAILSRAFHVLIQNWQLDPENNPLTFQAALTWIRNYNPAKGSGTSGGGRRTSDWKESTVRALEQLCVGQFGRAMNVQSSMALDQLLDHNVIFELDGLDNDQKLFFTEVLLLWLRERFLADMDHRPKEQLRLMLVIEEAHNVLKTGQERNTNESVLEQTLRETRSLGMGVIIIDQTPAYINKVATSNVFTSIYLSLQGRNNVSAAADALLLDEDQRNLLGRLPVGMAVCKMQDHWVDPFLLKIPLMDNKQAIVSDDDVTIHMKKLGSDIKHPSDTSGEAGGAGGSGDSGGWEYQISQSEVIPLVSAVAKRGISEEDKRFLVDILEQPFIGMAGRYKRLDISTRKGNNLRQKLERQGLVAVRHINTRKAQIKLPELTYHGTIVLKEMGYIVKQNGSRGSLEHRYWIHRVAEHYQKLGYIVTIEKSLPSGKRVDVQAVKKDERLAIEIETGKSDIQSNLDKLTSLGYTKIIFVPTTNKASQRCKELASNRKNVLVRPAGSF